MAKKKKKAKKGTPKRSGKPSTPPGHKFGQLKTPKNARVISGGLVDGEPVDRSETECLRVWREAEFE